jgi:hypothetical protein
MADKGNTAAAAQEMLERLRSKPPSVRAWQNLQLIDLTLKSGGTLVDLGFGDEWAYSKITFRTKNGSMFFVYTDDDVRGIARDVERLVGERLQYKMDGPERFLPWAFANPEESA